MCNFSEYTLGSLFTVKAFFSFKMTKLFDECNFSFTLHLSANKVHLFKLTYVCAPCSWTFMEKKIFASQILNFSLWHATKVCCSFYLFGDEQHKRLLQFPGWLAKETERKIQVNHFWCDDSCKHLHTFFALVSSTSLGELEKKCTCIAYRLI